MERQREREGQEKRETFALLPHFFSLLQDIGNHREEDQRKKEGKELEGGEGGVWRLGEELAANFAITEKQNAEGKWGSRGGEV